MKTIAGIEGYKALVGEQLGESDWLRVDQERINQFADATGDHQWIHVDVEKARQGPFGTTIAHGFLTLSLIPRPPGRLLKPHGPPMRLTYRLPPRAWRVPARARAAVRTPWGEDVGGGVRVAREATTWRGGKPTPPCAAEPATRLYV